MLYILNLQYEPNTAPSNRLMGYYHALDNMGIEATIVFLFPNKAYDKIPEQFNHLKVVYYWKRWILYRGFFARFTLLPYINRFIKQLRPGDVVYTYSVSKLTRVCQDVSEVRVYAERTEHPEASSGFLHPMLALTKDEYVSTINKLDGLFVISEPLKEYYSGLGLSPDKIKIINMIVDPSRFDGIVKQINPEKYIAYCGTVSNNKDGVNELIEAFALFSKRVPEVKLYIIGSCPNRKELEENMAIVKKYQIDDRVIFMGKVAAEKMPQILTNAEVLALDRPDNIQAKYGFPTKLGEYLLTGNPVVVTSVGDIYKFLKDGESALIANPCDTKDFSSKLVWAFTNPRKAKKIGQKGKEVAMLNFNSNREINKLISFIYGKI